MGNENIEYGLTRDQPNPPPGKPLPVDHDDNNNNSPSTPLPRGWRFWAVFSAICFTTLLAAVESTVVSTALPVIARELDAGNLYVWFVNAYFLTSTAFLPLIGQMCDLFGRRWMMIAVVSLFALGSGVAGGADSAAMMIAGRAVQGIGGGGINLLIELVVSDLVPLRQRGAYMGLVFGVFSLGTAVGPLVGGAIVDGTTWRWVFYINLPVSGAALILHLLFLRVNYDRETSILERLKKIDYAGNAILIGSVVSVLIALSWGGTRYEWKSYQILVPLFLGVFGLVLFHIYEGAPWVRDYPTLPERVFKRRTPAAALVIAFINFICLFWTLYFLPIYFQAVLGMSPTVSGLALLPTALLSVVTGAIAGVVLTKTGRYRPLHIVAFALIVLALGLFSRFNRNTSHAEWVIIQIIAAFGLGIMMSTNLPAVQADLPESDTAAATAAFAFVRAYGSIWGVSIPAAIFNAKFARESWRIDDPQIEDRLSGGNAYEYANADFIRSFPEPQRDRVIDVYARSLQLIWQVSLAFALLGFLICFLEKEIALRAHLETEFGLEEKRPAGGLEAGSDTTEVNRPAQE
ncbi:MFS general substrate transporter [Daldinia caldariorum]|uniref:MFS general substrate transporter n=1 Tax=Daldinia caldariorum TaxID=326644 RepID=UPI002008B912|nr:MFS general substrate transporter [Daldinia caldariorum]KAI1472377.1 MFS general substrate transporter [Daldinia caldariorum]